MARKPRSEWSPAYRARIESAERRGLSRAEARGHPEESREAIGASVWRQVDRAAEGAVSATVMEGPFGPGGAWTTVYVAVDANGRETIVDVGKGRRMTHAQRDKLKARVRNRLRDRDLNVPTIGTP